MTLLRRGFGGRALHRAEPNGDARGFSATRVFAVMIKEFKQLTRDRLTYAMMLAMPVVQLLLFGYAINSEPRHLPTALLVQEDTIFARSITSALRNSAYFDLTAQARTPAELDDMIRRGEVQFAVTIPGDFTRRVVRGDQAQMLVEVDATDPAATGPARGPGGPAHPGARRRPEGRPGPESRRRAAVRGGGPPAL